MRRRTFSESEAAGIWAKWGDGTSISDIARAYCRAPGTIHTFLASRGGIRPRRTTHRNRALTSEERENISRGLAAGESFRAISRGLGRAASTVSREVNRNGGRSRYRA